jgi:hypothetical protein
MRAGAWIGAHRNPEIQKPSVSKRRIWAIQGAPGAYLLTAYRIEAKKRMVILALGIIAASLQGLLASFAVMSLDESNAARYRMTADNLDALAGRPLEEARTAAAAPAAEGGEAEKAREQVLAFVGSGAEPDFVGAPRMDCPAQGRARSSARPPEELAVTAALMSTFGVLPCASAD